MVLKWLPRFCPDPEQQIATFCKGRVIQPDDEFVASCGLATDPEAARVALAVRRAVANVGSVESGYIVAADVYPDQLAMLPLWDSMDWVAFMMELEEQLGTRISDQEAERLFDPYRISVKEMVEGVRAMLARRAVIKGADQ